MRKGMVLKRFKGVWHFKYARGGKVFTHTASCDAGRRLAFSFARGWFLFNFLDEGANGTNS